MAEKTGRRVLVVDDASLVRRFYRDALERAGFHVEEALNGIEALEKLLAIPVDMMIVDVNMPRMDGFTFLHAVRRRDLPLSSTPALVISTEAGLQDFAAARAAGANFYLVKPVSPDELAECAAMLCGVPA
ncbi:MAG TPA: response regulator [Burkholderiales bacterium]|nr:response regulator [Burkholderiales bacterium]